MKLSRLFWLFVILFLGWLFYWGMHRNPKELKSVLIGKPAPDFTLPPLQPFKADYGDTFRFADYVGKMPIVLNFWASWCYPACYEEAPILEAAWERHKDGVLFLGINTQDKEEKALEFVRRFGLTFPNLYDPRGKVGIDYGMYGVPETFFIDRQGIVRYRHAGAIDAEMLEEKIQEVLR